MDPEMLSQSEEISVKAGFLKSIQLKNFMCHDNFEVKFNQNINFIIGKNGSGKSAVQTGIAVGLGGKALATNRGSSLKDLIKSDKNNASILIVLNNEGPRAFKPDLYGGEVRVERHFTRSSSGYKIRDESGKVVSTEKKELDRMVRHFNIQTQNPICILHQDVARNFLNTSDPKKKFDFFMRATRIAEVDKMYSDIQHQLDVMLYQFQNKRRIIEETFKDVIEMKKKMAVMEEAKQKERQQEKLENELVWSRVREIETQLEESQRIKGLETMSKAKLLKKLKEGDHSQFKEELRDLENQIKDIDNKVMDARGNKTQAQQTYFEKKAATANLLKECRDIKENEKRARIKLTSCQQELENFKSNASGAKERQEKIRQELESCEKALEQLKPAEANTQLQRQQSRDTMDRHEQNLRSVSERLHTLRNKRHKFEGQIKDITNSASNLAVYGNTTVRIAEEINRKQNQFRQKPIGPLGLHIKVKDPKWTGAVENFLTTSLLSAFCVDNSADLQVLNGIFKSVCPPGQQPSIYCSKFLPQKHNIQGQETGTNQHMNLARMLQIENPVVFNTLVDQLDIQTTLLIPTNDEVYGLLEREHQVPRYCKKAFTLTGDMFFPAPNYKSITALREVTRARFLQANQQDIIRSLKEDVARLNQDIAAQQEDERSVQQELRNLSKFLEKTEATASQLKRKKNQLDTKINELRDSMEPDNEGNEIFLQREAETLRERVEQENQVFEEMRRKCEESKNESDEAKMVLEAIQNTIAEADKAKAPILSKIQQLKSQIQQASSQGDIIKHKIKEHDRKLTEIETEITEMTEKLEENTEQASQVCEPVISRRNTSDIVKDLNNVKQYLKKLTEESGGSFSDLEKTYLERKANFSEANNCLIRLQKIHDRIETGMGMRSGTRKRILDMKIEASKFHFTNLIDERHLDGKLIFDLMAETLEIKVSKPDDLDKTASKRATDTASLSGGEKSFSTVCFIMTLWQTNTMPFHFLDEFDVFMDGINRHTVMEILINFAENSRSQFVLLTPLNTSSFKEKDNLSIFRLKAPRE